MSSDPFGLDAEKRIIQSNVRNIFMPHQPIQSLGLFFGRQSEVQRIVQAILTPGQHVLLYGDRGVGKSSLANVTRELILKQLVGGQVIVKACDSSTDFASLSKHVLRGLGIDLGGATSTTENVVTSEGAVDAVVARGSHSRSRRRLKSHAAPAHSLTPSDVAASMSGYRGLLVLDEFDAMARVQDRRQVAELIKQLSDAGSGFKVLAVGIAASATELLAGHPSVQRNVREVHLGRMSDEEIAGLVEKNAKQAKISFAASAITDIVGLSAGYPHFAQLLGLKCAELVIGDGRTDVTPVDLAHALSLAVGDAEETLTRSYADAVRSYQTETYKIIVESAAELGQTEFSAKDLRDGVSRRIGRSVNQGEMNNHFGRLVSGDGSRILTREAKGVYRFSDPRMKSYVRIAARASADDR